MSENTIPSAEDLYNRAHDINPLLKVEQKKLQNYEDLQMKLSKILKILVFLKLFNRNDGADMKWIQLFSTKSHLSLVRHACHLHGYMQL